MTPSIRDILAPLEPHQDRILRTPLSGVEVDDLEERVGLRAPTPLREYFMEVGFFQDLTWGTSTIEVHESPGEVASAREFLTRLLPAQHAGLFPFGGDGAGNEFCVPSGEGASTRIHFVDHETGKVSPRKEFSEWLESVVAKTLRGIRKRPPNDRKVWAVCFTLPGISFAELLALLGSVGEARAIDPDWIDTTEEGQEVASSERAIKLNGQRILVGKLEYEGWARPLVSFNLREPVLGLAHSQIRRLDTLFKANWSGYKLVDYGALDSLALEKIERGR